jgi:eukaryotic-like serine/threonine-protein kinase
VNAEGPRVGTTIGEKYMVLRFMAEGGMGAVYEAQHLFLRRRFAIKFLRRDLARRRDVLARFTQEARAAGALEHENIAAGVDFGVALDGTPYLVMEYLDGIDLAELLASSGPLPTERAADLVLQAAVGVHAAHSASLIHRDLKPRNLFLCRRSDGTDLVKLIDFGVAKLLTSDGAVTHTGAMLGTPAYMSPEQARGEATIDARADIYALGVILYELLSGRTPHPGGSNNAVIHHIATDQSIPLTSQGRDLPEPLVELVHRALSADATLRPATAAELAHELQAFARRTVWPDSSATVESSEVGIESTLLAVATDGAKARGQSRSAALLDSGERGGLRQRLRTRAWVIGLALSGLAVLIGASLVGRSALLPHTEVAPPAARRPAPASPSVAVTDSPVAATSSEQERAEMGPALKPLGRVASEPAARPRDSAERPRGHPPGPLRAASPAPKASPADETGVSFDDKNPYK